MSALNNISQDEQELIEKYLDGTLNSEEQQLVTEKAATDPLWSEKISEMQWIITGINESFLAAQLDQFHKALPLKKSPAIIQPLRANRKRYLLAAAAVLAIVFLAGGFLLFNKPVNEKIFAGYYEPDPGLPTVMSVSDNYDFDKAMVDYKMGKYKSAIALWEPLLKQHPESDTLNYFLGSAYLADDDPKTSGDFFDKVIAAKTSVFANDAKWYKALSLIGQNDLQSAVPLLESLQTENAKQLLKKIAENSRK